MLWMQGRALGVRCTLPAMVSLLMVAVNIRRLRTASGLFTVNYFILAYTFVLESSPSVY